ncbi:MAG: LysR substrate-binding domain-containing protein [Erysipelotrichaceae bacterium]
MTLRGLKIFVTVVETGKMVTAANQLFIAQPTISQTIIELEKEYKVQLFERLNKKLYLTQEGTFFYEYAKRILQMVDELNDNMKSLSSRKTIRLGATITISQSILVSLVQEFESLHPNIEIVVKIDNSSSIEKLLLSNELDIALIEGTIKHSELASMPFLDDELVLVCSPLHPLATKHSTTLDSLSQFSFITREEGSGTREYFESLLHQHHVQIHTKWNCYGFDAILEATIANQGITVLSQRLVEGAILQGLLTQVKISDISLTRQFSVAYHKTKFLSEPLLAWLAYLDAYAQTH